jgi:hypothetical protein
MSGTPPILDTRRPATIDAVRLPSMINANKYPKVVGLTPMNSMRVDDKAVSIAKSPAKGPIPTYAYVRKTRDREILTKLLQIN